MLETTIQLTSRNVSDVYNFSQSSKQGNFFRSQYFYVLVFHHRQLIKDASIFRLCTAVDHTTHRAQGSDQVWEIPFCCSQMICKGLNPERPPPSLTRLFCRFWLHACSRGQFPRNTLPFLMLVIKYIFLHSSVEIRHSSTAHHMKSFLFPALCLLTKIRPCTLLLAHTCLLTEQNYKNILILPSHQPYITNSQTLLKQLMF